MRQRAVSPVRGSRIPGIGDVEAVNADPGKASEWGSSGMEASREYQWDRVTDRVLEVYRRVVGE